MREKGVCPEGESGISPLLNRGGRRRGAGALDGGGVLERESPRFDAREYEWALGGTEVYGMYLFQACGKSSATLGLGVAIPSYVRSSAF